MISIKQVFLLIISAFILQSTHAQVSFKIEELSLSNYNIELNKDIIEEDLENGPYIYFKCTIFNNTNDSVLLKPTGSSTNLLFRYQKNIYVEDVFPLPFMDNKSLTIPPGGKTYLFGGTYILLGTEIFDSNKSNYTNEMLEILPTIRIRYKDDCVRITTDEIIDVILK